MIEHDARPRSANRVLRFSPAHVPASPAAFSAHEPGERKAPARLPLAWDKLRRKHHRIFRRCQAQPSPARIHTLRVISRELLAQITLLQALSPGPELQRAKR